MELRILLKCQFWAIRSFHCMLCCSDSELYWWITSLEMNFTGSYRYRSRSSSETWGHALIFWCSGVSILNTIWQTLCSYAEMHKIFVARKSSCTCRVLSLATIRSKYYFNFILMRTRSGRELFDRPSYYLTVLWTCVHSVDWQFFDSITYLSVRNMPACAVCSIHTEHVQRVHYLLCNSVHVGIHNFMITIFVLHFRSVTLEDILSPLLVDQSSADKQTILVSRRFFWQSVKRGVSQEDFSFNKPLAVIFSGEDAEDQGGPRREFFKWDLLDSVWIYHCHRLCVVTCLNWSRGKETVLGVDWKLSMAY